MMPVRIMKQDNNRRRDDTLRVQGPAPSVVHSFSQ